MWVWKWTTGHGKKRGYLKSRDKACLVSTVEHIYWLLIGRVDGYWFSEYLTNPVTFRSLSTAWRYWRTVLVLSLV
jgi:hypothetical protein